MADITAAVGWWLEVISMEISSNTVTMIECWNGSCVPANELGHYAKGSKQ